jgi:hypothetical protein
MVGFESDADYSAACRGLAAFRARCGVPADYEFKFNKLSRDRRLGALEAVSEGEYWVRAFVLRKDRLWAGAMQKPAAMYQKVAGWLLANAVAEVSGSELVWDRCGNRQFYRLIQSEIHSHCASRRQEPPRVFTIADSREVQGLQVADLVCGAIARRYTDKADKLDYMVQFKRRVRQLRAWPSN